MDLLRATFYKRFESDIKSPKMTEISLLFVDDSNMNDYYSVLKKVFSNVFSSKSIECRSFLCNRYL